jgi:hypothetical protein
LINTLQTDLRQQGITSYFSNHIQHKQAKEKAAELSLMGSFNFARTKTDASLYSYSLFNNAIMSVLKGNEERRGAKMGGCAVI